MSILNHVVCLAVARAAYLGARVGSLSTLAHLVSGEVYALNHNTLRILNFNYDGKAPCKYDQLRTVQEYVKLMYYHGQFNQVCKIIRKISPWVIVLYLHSDNLAYKRDLPFLKRNCWKMFWNRNVFDDK